MFLCYFFFYCTSASEMMHEAVNPDWALQYITRLCVCFQLSEPVCRPSSGLSSRCIFIAKGNTPSWRDEPDLRSTLTFLHLWNTQIVWRLKAFSGIIDCWTLSRKMLFYSGLNGGINLPQCFTENSLTAAVHCGLFSSPMGRRGGTTEHWH